MGFTGRTWQKLPEFNPKLVSEYAVKVYGSGHVVAYNSIANFHDGVDVATYGNPDGTPKPIRDRLPVSIDFYGNDISNVEDNCIEADGGAHNIRIFRNRCFNHGHRALSVQPMFGGPVYFIRNIVYHAPEGGAVKFTASSSGIVVLPQHVHRAGEADAAGRVERALPQQPDSREERDARDLRRRDQHQLLELRLQRLPAERGRRVLVRMEHAAAVACAPNFPGEPGTLSDAGSRRSSRRKARERRRFKTLEGVSATATGQDAHSVLVDYDVFVKVAAAGTGSAHALQAGGLRLPASSRLGRSRCRRPADRNQR